jgi:hypothetical protein
MKSKNQLNQKKLIETKYFEVFLLNNAEYINKFIFSSLKFNNKSIFRNNILMGNCCSA